MNFIDTEIAGVCIIEPDVYADARGFFMESFNARRYAEHGLPELFVQDNLSCSETGVLRGLHLQYPNPQGKLVSVLQGEVYDVAVDVRIGSPSFGQHVGVYLSAENKRQLWIPEGLAHGFVVTRGPALFSYKCTTFYEPGAELSIRWDDPELAIQWPQPDPALSDKDRQAPRLAELEAERLPPYAP